MMPHPPLDALLTQAARCHQTGEHEQALALYQQALAVDDQNPAIHLALGHLYAQLQQPDTALKHYHQALHLAPEWPEAHYQTGLFFLKSHHFHYASTQFHNVLALQPSHFKALFHAGVCALQRDQLQEAQTLFEAVLKQQPEDIDALVNLGALALKQDQGQRAIDYFTKALTLDPAHEAARANLAAAFMHYHRHENALTHYLLLLENWPDNPEYRYNAAVSEMTLGQYTQARTRLEQLLQEQPQQFSLLYNLAIIALRLHQPDQAQHYITLAVRINPEDPGAQHLSAALRGEGSSSYYSKQHALRLFEQYALYYDKHMLSALAYQLPTLLETLLQAYGPYHATLDLGCGTGLCGERLRPFTQRLVGVDLSPNMLTRAQEKDCYDTCIAQEATDYLSQTAERFDLIVAADLFPYIGELAPCFEGVDRCLQSGGFFGFSVEPASVLPWRLQETVRYAHHEDYIRALCDKQHWHVLSAETKMARSQAGHALKVLIFLIQKAA